jgi:NAD(P)-dependent dehydrogenase (short-subunit alcohol dehydrogenase family)/putative sterol carrier protein
MGRELVLALAAEGCSVATCDLREESLRETDELARASARAGTRVTTHACDVSDESAVIRFKDEVVAQHQTDYINLLFNNAGIAGAGSFLADDRGAWERVFGVCWYGVYYCARVFMPLLIASDEGYIVNTSSANGFWAMHGPGAPSTAYGTAKFAVKGFSEALVEDLRTNAPHVRVAVVMPGGISGTAIGSNSQRILGLDPFDLHLESMRGMFARIGLPVEHATEEQIQRIWMMMERELYQFGTSATQAAKTILDGVREGRWRIIVGEDAKRLDEATRADPEAAYEPDFPGLGLHPWVAALLLLRERLDGQVTKLSATYELRNSERQISLRVAHGRVELAQGPAQDPDAVLELDPDSFRALLKGDLSLHDAIASNALKLTGDSDKVEQLLSATAVSVIA